MSDSQTYGLTIKELFIVDSTSIRLFTDILKGVGRNPKNYGKKKGGLKVHMLIDASQSIAKFVKITEAKMHDKQFMKEIQVPAYSMLVFDKAYNFYRQFAYWTNKHIYFVTRQKTNAIYTMVQTLVDTAGIKNKAMIYREEIIEVMIYKKRWEIELLFKKMKQNFQLSYIYGENENAILQKKAAVKKGIFNSC